MLKGKSVDLRAVERSDIERLYQWYNDSDFFGENEPIPSPITREGLERLFLEPKGHSEGSTFIILKKDGVPIGDINHRGGTQHSPMEIGYALVPNERGRGYGTEAIAIMVDYLILAQDIQRIQATTLTDNKPSQRALEKAGFIKEGLMRKSSWVRGRWRDDFMYAITRDDWRGPRILSGHFPD